MRGRLGHLNALIITSGSARCPRSFNRRRWGPPPSRAPLFLLAGAEEEEEEDEGAEPRRTLAARAEESLARGAGGLNTRGASSRRFAPLCGEGRAVTWGIYEKLAPAPGPPRHRGPISIFFFLLIER